MISVAKVILGKKVITKSKRQNQNLFEYFSLIDMFVTAHAISIWSLLSLMLLYCTEVTFAVRFYLPQGQKRCFTQDLPTGHKITGEVQVSGNKGDMNIDVWVTTLQGKVLYHRCAPSHGKLSFQTPPSERVHEDDIYLHEFHDDEDTFRICIEHQQNPSLVHTTGASRVVTLRLGDVQSGVVRHKRAASLSDTDRLLRSMRSMHTQLSAMVGDLTELERRERNLVNSVVLTARHVSLLAIASLLVISATSTLQIWYYKVYFKYKKVC